MCDKIVKFLNVPENNSYLIEVVQTKKIKKTKRIFTHPYDVLLHHITLKIYLHTNFVLNKIMIAIYSPALIPGTRAPRIFPLYSC
jgi:hypothetical protein